MTHITQSNYAYHLIELYISLNAFSDMHNSISDNTKYWINSKTAPQIYEHAFVLCA